MTAIEARIVDQLVAMGIVPEECANEGTDAVIRRIKRSFRQRQAIIATLNPDRILGERIREEMEEQQLTQRDLLLKVNEYLIKINGRVIANESSISRYCSGIYSLTALQFLAIAMALEVPIDRLSPWVEKESVPFTLDLRR